MMMSLKKFGFVLVIITVIVLPGGNAHAFRCLDGIISGDLEGSVTFSGKVVAVRRGIIGDIVVFFGNLIYGPTYYSRTFAPDQMLFDVYESSNGPNWDKVWIREERNMIVGPQRPFKLGDVVTIRVQGTADSGYRIERVCDIDWWPKN